MGLRTLIVIPAYNEEGNIGPLLNKIYTLFPSQDVLIVDDGSQDKTAVDAEKAGAKVIKQAKNLGKGLALRRGFDFAIQSGYDEVITMDGDGQHNPSEIPKFLSASKREEGNLIIGTRNHNLLEMPLVRFFVNNITSLIASLLAGIRIHDSQSGYRLIKTKLLKDIDLKTSRFQTETEIIVKAVRSGFQVKEIPIEILYIDKSRSHINPLIDTIRFFILALKLLWR